MPNSWSCDGRPVVCCVECVKLQRACGRHVDAALGHLEFASQDRRAANFAAVSTTNESPLSDQLVDTAGEIACRLEMGEFDDLDAPLLCSLIYLSQRMSLWANRAVMLERAVGGGQAAVAPGWARGSGTTFHA